MEEQPRKLDHVVRVAHYIQFRAEPLIDPKSEVSVNEMHLNLGRSPYPPTDKLTLSLTGLYEYVP